MEKNSLNELSARVEQLTKAGETCATEQVIQSLQPKPPKDDILQLIYTEVTTREDSGELISVEHLVERFPDFAEPIERLMAVHRQLAEKPVTDSGNQRDTFSQLEDQTTELDEATSHLHRSIELPERFEIKQLLGSGGMGLVYLAQDRQLDRPLAIKVLKLPSWDDKYQIKVIREGQAVSKLQHQNIVQLYDMALDGPNPFLCYEWIDGPSLAERLNSGTLDPKLATDWILQVCNGLSVAHKNSIVHRDIKPANILIAADGTAKITDFGLAKQLGSSDQTQTSGMIGSVAYMSPEQIDGDSQDRRIDIYGVGATLYEMLTGQPPLIGATPVETIRMIQNVEPRPLRERNQAIPRDLETICLKCLEKDPSQRFKTITDLSDELNRFRDGRPLNIRPVSWLGRLNKWSRRNPRVVVLLSLLTALMLVISIGGYVAFYYQRQLSKQLRDSNEKVSQKADEAKAINDFLVTSWTSARPSRDGRKVLVSDRLQSAVKYLLEKPLKNPNTQADLLFTMGKTQARLGYYDDAVVTLQNAFDLHSELLEKDDPSRLESMIELGDVNIRLGSLDEARKLLNVAVALLENAKEVNHRRLIHVRNHLAYIHNLKGEHDEAIQSFEKNLADSREFFEPFHHLTLMTLSDYVMSLNDSGQNKLAYETLMKTLPQAEKEKGLNDEAILSLKSKQASLLRDLSRYEEAVAVYAELQPVYEEYFGPDHSMTLTLVNNHSAATSDLGNYEKVARLQCDLVERFTRVFEANHPNVIRLNLNAGQAMDRCGNIKEARKYLLVAYENSRTLKPGDSTRSLSASLWGAFVASHIDPAKGVDILRAAFEEIDKVKNVNPGLRVRLLSNLTTSLRHLGNVEESLEMAKKAQLLSNRHFGPTHLETINADNNLASALSNVGKTEESIQAFKKLIQKLTDRLSDKHPRTMMTEYSLAIKCREAGDPDAGVNLLISTVPRMEKHLGNAWMTELARFELGRGYLESGKLEKADQTLKEALEKLESLLPNRRAKDSTSIANQLRTIIRQMEEAKFLKSIDFWKEAEQRLRKN